MDKPWRYSRNAPSMKVWAVDLLPLTQALEDESAAGDYSHALGNPRTRIPKWSQRASRAITCGASLSALDVVSTNTVFVDREK